MKVLVTGSAGFIGFHLIQKLIASGIIVCGIDNINDYYDTRLKKSRNAILSKSDLYTFFHNDIIDDQALKQIFSQNSFDAVIHLAAQAGVRYSIENPMAYAQSNLIGFMTILEACRHNKIQHLIFASSSSVYGINGNVPFSEKDNVDHPVSLYAATKKSNELLAHSYADLYDLPVTGLRFFTVYGPYGRPDMAYFKFTKAIADGTVIDIYNNGDMLRDFTYIDDIVEGIYRLIPLIPKRDLMWDTMNSDPASSRAPYKIYNIGNNKPVKLLDFISTIERHYGKDAQKRMLPMQPGDVPQTFADIENLYQATGYRPLTPLDKGIEQFVAWYKKYYR